jgi:hypothetical protein
MPEKQTRESIEAELNASEDRRLALQLKEAIRELDELEAELQRLEKARGLPAFSRTKPLRERMAALGMRREAIDCISDLLDAMSKGELGKMDEVPEGIRRKLAERTEASISALGQLQDILDARQKR